MTAARNPDRVGPLKSGAPPARYCSSAGAEIMRFKQDLACRLFLSTGSGSVGLNLRVASAVVNVDLPWNPAKLEQRIARA
jgi:hypothetical protein